MTRKLTPLKLRSFKKRIIGFDVETYGVKNEFYCASLVGDGINNLYFSKRELIDDLKSYKFRDSIIVATNLQFDFMALFFGEPEINNFRWQWRGSDIIYARTYLHDGEFFQFSKIEVIGENGKKEFKRSKGQILFIDTMNYAKLSVEKMGKILSLPKLSKPMSLGKIPKNREELEELLIYNLRDSEISYNFINFLFKAFQDLGGTPQKTIASSAMNLFRTKYLKNVFYQHQVTDILEMFKGYYGGRTEAFERGYVKDLKYYDFNSLYPSVMLEDVPNPNTIRVTCRNNIEKINGFEGLSKVRINCPFMQYPLLPFRTKDKLIFPVGTFEGWYTHIELREAIRLGYTILKVYKSFYFKETISIFNDYVTDLYNKRLMYKTNKSPMEYVVKILLNSLYGKFGQKFIDRENWQPFNLSKNELSRFDSVKRVGDFVRVKIDLDNPPVFTFPEICSYITARARLKLHKAILLCKPVYVDTDSLMTKRHMPEGHKLGELKLEMHIKEGYIIKPKFYALIDSDNNHHVKIKGVGKRLDINTFKILMNTYKEDKIAISYTKILKFKESQRRINMIPNMIIKMTKNLTLNDDKRIWNSDFSMNGCDGSIPIDMNHTKNDQISNTMLNPPIINPNNG